MIITSSQTNDDLESIRFDSFRKYIIIWIERIY